MNFDFAYACYNNDNEAATINQFSVLQSFALLHAGPLLIWPAIKEPE